jgi:hypothetical protein
MNTSKSLIYEKILADVKKKMMSDVQYVLLIIETIVYRYDGLDTEQKPLCYVSV